MILVMFKLHFDVITASARHHAGYMESSYHSHKSWFMSEPLSSLEPTPMYQDISGRKQRTIFFNLSCFLLRVPDIHPFRFRMFLCSFPLIYSRNPCLSLSSIKITLQYFLPVYTLYGKLIFLSQGINMTF